MGGILLICCLVGIFILAYWLPAAEMKTGLRHGFLRFKGAPDNLRVRARGMRHGSKTAERHDETAEPQQTKEPTPKSKRKRKPYHRKP